MVVAAAATIARHQKNFGVDGTECVCVLVTDDCVPNRRGPLSVSARLGYSPRMSMSSASVQRGPAPMAGAPGGTSLRSIFEARFAAGQRFSLVEAIGMFVPLCIDMKSHHDAGERLYVHPSCIVAGPDGFPRLEPSLAVVPTSARDRACTPPELERTLEPGGARASVFAIGAMLYEAVTGQTAGAGMVRPRDVDPSLPTALETLLAKALVSDPAHRPDDLGALASALHAIAPQSSLAPPPVDPANLDHGGDFDVDISLSLIPPANPAPVVVMPTGIPNGVGANGQARAVPAPASSGAIVDPFAAVAAPNAAPSRPKVDPTAQLAQLKQQLESDPRPRYVVHKDRMDHGPFAAVELLQQIASHKFLLTDVLRDEISGESRPIGEWTDFAPFADQAALKREIVAEKKAVAEVAQKDKRAGVAKGLIGAVLLLGIVGAAGFYLYKKVGERKDDVEMADDNNVAIDVQGGVKGQKRGGGAGGRGGAGGGGFAAGMSYEAALSSNVQEVNIGKGSGPDLTDGQLNAPMRNASFISGCGAPDSMKVTVKVAVKNGRAVGVSVYPSPPDAKVASCVDRHVRGLSWPSSPKMDSFTTTY